jgi:uncharacterized protein YbjT (DUF2867 family)
LPTFGLFPICGQGTVELSKDRYYLGERMNTTLVTGGTGKTGRRLVRRLTAAGVPVRIGSRSGGLPFDWTDRSTWAPVLRDVTAAYISYYPDLATPGAAAAVGELAVLAASLGVRRLVMLSGRGEPEAEAAERAVQAAGADWTIVRASWFSQNFSENYLLDPVLDGEVILPAGPVPEPFVDADDIADVAAEALTGAGHAGQVYEVTGPRLLTFADAVQVIAAATGRQIGFTSVPVAGYVAALEAEGVPADITSLIGYLFSTVLDGRNAHLTDGVQRAVGRAPRDFADYARETAATGIWNRKEDQ